MTSVMILSKYLADSYYLYLKTHNFHWNVTGPLFFSLHKMFEEQYKKLLESLDPTAERIRTFSKPVPATTKQFKELTCLSEVEDVPSARDMIKFLLDDHELMIRNLRDWIQDTVEDAATQDYLLMRLEEHEKIAWMLRSSF